MSSKPVIIVTGASRGIGLAVTRLLLEEHGAMVVALSRSRTAELNQLSGKHHNQLLVINCDVTDVQAVQAAVSTTIKTLRSIDGLVLNAGIIGPVARIADPDSGSLDQWKSCFDLNLFSLVTMLKLTTPYLSVSKHAGRVIFVSSGAAVGNMGAWGAYNASKAAMNSLCRTYASEEKSIVSVAVRPGMVDTDMQATLRSVGKASMAAPDLDRFVKAHENGTLVKVDDCGYVIATLAIKAPLSLSGQFVSWDGDECREFRKDLKTA